MGNLGRRRKRYQAETGVSFEYFFDSRRRVVRPEGKGAGSDFNFVITGNRERPQAVTIFLADRALDHWRSAHGSALGSTEQFALAKMRLFRALDEMEFSSASARDLIVDETNVEPLLEPLDIA